MINSDINSNGLGNNATGIATFHKRSPIATKKIALRDVHNNSRSLLPNGKETSLLLDGRALTDATKVSGIKRPTSDHASTQTSPPPLTNNATNDHFMYARRKLESDVGKGRNPGNSNTHPFTELPSFKNFTNVQKNMHGPPSITQQSNHMASARAYSNNNIPSVPNFLGKPGNVFSEATWFRGTGEQKRRERQNRLQNYIKHCDDKSTLEENVQRLLHLSPAELSRRAVELEKRAIQLTIEEGKEIQRMYALNILEKPASAKASLQALQKRQPQN